MDFSIRILVLIQFAVVTICLGQKSNAVQWQFKTETLPNNELVLTLIADIASGWHLYSQYNEEGGPIPTRISFDPSPDFAIIGTAQEEGTPVKFHDEIYNMEITWFSGTVSFSQRLHLKQPGTDIKCRIDYMTCNNSTCLPGKQQFTIDTRFSK